MSRCPKDSTESTRCYILVYQVYLARQGFPLRGDEHDYGAFYQLVKERSGDVASVSEWMTRRDTWMSDTIQNEILAMLAHEVQRVIVDEARMSEFYGITADGTTDVSGREQFSVTLQYTTQDFDTKSKFLGFYNAPDSTGETLFKVIMDIFLRLNLSISHLQGYCFDGASNMSGMNKGVQARLKSKCPDAVFVHCANHSLDLALQGVRQ